MKALNTTEVQAIVGMYNEGAKVSTISEYSGRSYMTIYRYLHKHGIILRTVPNWSKFRKVAHTRNLLQYKLEKLGAL